MSHDHSEDIPPSEADGTCQGTVDRPGLESEAGLALAELCTLFVDSEDDDSRFAYYLTAYYGPAADYQEQAPRSGDVAFATERTGCVHGQTRGYYTVEYGQDGIWQAEAPDPGAMEALLHRFADASAERHDCGQP
ncbi:hypothetical protein [Streptomyces sp. 7-21]|uniref:hypothetical protein n=1 Tax=Streptomyces sp. 7-21 TaxID=2802283 RepID=UPI00191D7657|nr:hypothetical protein [Streptomyces sp. 7-21]MBL1068138.1 hypothetical protein [Streptomyces sp. 7-21]